MDIEIHIGIEAIIIIGIILVALIIRYYKQVK